MRISSTDAPLPSDPRVSLLDFLRNHLALPGAKKGCEVAVDGGLAQL
jgi:xanthine dehydrogenase YagT iron-sulfur-binding subunit